MCCDHRVCQRSAGSAWGEGGGAWREREGGGLSVRGAERGRCADGGEKRSRGAGPNRESGGEMRGTWDRFLHSDRHGADFIAMFLSTIKVPLNEWMDGRMNE